VVAVFITNLAVTTGWTSDVRGQLHLDGLGALGDIGWYCIRLILWAYGFEMPRSVTAHSGSKVSDTGVLTSCGATFEWEDGRVGTFRTSFLGDMVMKGMCVGSKGTLEVDDFVIPRTEGVASYRVKEAATWEDRSTGWGAREQVHQVSTSLPQEALMVQEFARLVSNILDGSGVPEPLWPTLARKTQLLLNAVKSSIETNCKTITL
jgi:predicted dehydrogenase